MTPSESLRVALEQFRSFRKDVPAEWVYRGNEDFVLRHGEEYAPRALPEEYDYGAPKMCYGNAIWMAEAFGLSYVEGFAWTGYFPIHHAWNADADGNLIDVTWRAEEGGLRIPMPNSAYLGVRFSVDRADDATWNGDGTVLDDWRRDWPLLRQEWTGEDDSIEYESSPLLVAMRTGDADVVAAALAAFREEAGL